MRKGLLISLSALIILAAVGGSLALMSPELIPEQLRPNGSAANTGQPASASESAARASTEAQRPRSGAGSAPIAVEALRVRQAKTSSDLRAIGSLRSDEAVKIASEIAGVIAAIPFEEGQAIKAGDVIAKLDDALVKAEVADAQARLTLAKQNDERARTLSRTGAVTGRTRDEAASTLETAAAAYELARTRLDKHTLRAPFDGFAGVRNVSIGAYVPIGSPIVNVEKIDVLKVDFKVPELFLSSIRIGQTIEVSVDAVRNRTFKGKIYAIDPLVDVNGRALSVRARLENPGFVLRPGLFARIIIKGLAEREVSLIPESAVVPRGGDAYVFRVDNGQAVEARVRLGERKNAEVEVLEGLDPLATVVTAGQQKLRNGSPVEVVSTAPDVPPETDDARRARNSAGGSG